MSPNRPPEFFPDGRRPISQNVATTAPLVLPVDLEKSKRPIDADGDAIVGQTSCAADTATASACLESSANKSPTHAAMPSSTVVEEHSLPAIRASRQFSGVYTYHELQVCLGTLRYECHGLLQADKFLLAVFMRLKLSAIP